jgi:Na+-transporting methylmalonyl-CoA/oxaloacetate decarboxylase gamma subunit
MDTSWAEALRIGGTGFGLVFIVLIILAIAISIAGKVIGRYDTAKTAVIEIERRKQS